MLPVSELHYKITPRFHKRISKGENSIQPMGERAISLYSYINVILLLRTLNNGKIKPLAISVNKNASYMIDEIHHSLNCSRSHILPNHCLDVARV